MLMTKVGTLVGVRLSINDIEYLPTEKGDQIRSYLDQVQVIDVTHGLPHAMEATNLPWTQQDVKAVEFLSTDEGAIIILHSVLRHLSGKNFVGQFNRTRELSHAYVVADDSSLPEALDEIVTFEGAFNINPEWNEAMKGGEMRYQVPEITVTPEDGTIGVTAVFRYSDGSLMDVSTPEWFTSDNGIIVKSAPSPDGFMCTFQVAGAPSGDARIGCWAVEQTTNTRVLLEATVIAKDTDTAASLREAGELHIRKQENHGDAKRPQDRETAKSEGKTKG